MKPAAPRSFSKMLWLVVGIVGLCMPTGVLSQEPTMAPTSNDTAAPTAAPTMAPSVSAVPTAPTAMPTRPPIDLPDGCYNSTALLFEAMLRSSSFFLETFVICPNTRLEVGFFNPDGTCCVGDTESPIFLRSRTHVLCGDDGSSANNCTLVGGAAHVFYVGTYFADLVALDVVVSGFTFEATQFISTALANQGEITFRDCIWKDNQGGGVVFTAFDLPPDQEGNERRRLAAGRRHLEEAGVDVEDPRALAVYLTRKENLQAWVNDVTADARANRALALASGQDRRALQAAAQQEVTFEDCLFMDNRQGPTGGANPLLGMIDIIAPVNPTNLRNVTFLRNFYDGSDGNMNGYALQSAGSAVMIDNVCLLNNSFIGFGPLQLFDGAPYSATNTFATEDDLIHCEFAAESTLEVPVTFAEVTCTSSDRLSCDGPMKPMGPTPSTTAEPTATPTSTPTTPSGASSMTNSWRLSLLVTGVCMCLLASIV